jgi:hypothetical protein
MECFVTCTAWWDVSWCALRNGVFCDVCFKKFSATHSLWVLQYLVGCYFGRCWNISFFFCFQVAISRINHILQIHKLVVFIAGHKWPVGSKEATNTECLKKITFVWVISFYGFCPLRTIDTMQTEFWSNVGACRPDSSCTPVCCTPTQQILWPFSVWPCSFSSTYREKTAYKR